VQIYSSVQGSQERYGSGYQDWASDQCPGACQRWRKGLVRFKLRRELAVTPDIHYQIDDRQIWLLRSAWTELIKIMKSTINPSPPILIYVEVLFYPPVDSFSVYL
jgi:hypothetical protein